MVVTGYSTAIDDIHTSLISRIPKPPPLREELNTGGDVLTKVISMFCLIFALINV